MTTTTLIFALLIATISAANCQVDQRNEYRIGFESAYPLLRDLGCFTCRTDYNQLEFSFETRQVRKSRIYFLLRYRKGWGSRPNYDYSNLREYRINNYALETGAGFMIWKGFSFLVSGYFGEFQDEGRYLYKGNFFDSETQYFSNLIRYHGFKLELVYYTPLIMKRIRFGLSTFYESAFSSGLQENEEYVNITHDSYYTFIGDYKAGFKVFLYVALFKKE